MSSKPAGTIQKDHASKNKKKKKRNSTLTWLSRARVLRNFFFNWQSLNTRFFFVFFWLGQNQPHQCQASVLPCPSSLALLFLLLELQTLGIYSFKCTESKSLKVVSSLSYKSLPVSHLQEKVVKTWCPCPQAWGPSDTQMRMH